MSDGTLDGMVQDSYDELTGCFVRAKVGGAWGSHSLGELMVRKGTFEVDRNALKHAFVLGGTAAIRVAKANYASLVPTWLKVALALTAAAVVGFAWGKLIDYQQGY